MRFTAGSEEHGWANSVEAIFEPLGLDEDLDSFLKRLVYGGDGNPYRHGTAVEGWRGRGLALVVALVAWLDLIAEDEREPLLAQAFSKVRPPMKLIVETLKERGFGVSAPGLSGGVAAPMKDRDAEAAEVSTDG